MTSEELLNEIKTIMGVVLLSANGKDGNFRPIKWTTRQQCYNVLGKIQTLLETDKVTIPIGGIVGGEKRELRGEMVRQMNEREKELFLKFYHGATIGDWLNIIRSLNEEIEELMKNINTKDHDKED